VADRDQMNDVWRLLDWLSEELELLAPQEVDAVGR
jgi:hypothetical protein